MWSMKIPIAWMLRWITTASLKAIGRGGQNVRLASELTGWVLNVMSEVQADEKADLESRTLVESFIEQLNVDEDVASILVQEGFFQRGRISLCSR